MKQERLRREARKRILARRELVRPHYEALREASDDDQLYPDFHLFASMPAVKEFWQEEDLTFDDGSWRSSLDRIKDEAAKATRWIKLEAARGLIAACDQVSAPVPDNVRLSIHPPRREGTPDSELSVTRDEGLVDSKLEVMPPETLLDIDDPSTISAAELDAFLSRFTARFVRRIGCTDPPVPLNDFYPQASGLFSYNDRKSIVWSAWLENQIDILEQTGLADDDEADAKLSELGPNFSCEDCTFDLSRPWRDCIPVGPMRDPPLPKRSFDLTWNQIASHLSSSPTLCHRTLMISFANM